MAADAVGGHNAALKGGASWTNGPQGGALLLDRFHRIRGHRRRDPGHHRPRLLGGRLGPAGRTQPALHGRLLKFGGRPVDFREGAIADVHVYDSALSAADVACLTAHEPGLG
ncbi:hypothetical protein ABZ746_32475 [Streptomyces sp. NPDC020096]